MRDVRATGALRWALSRSSEESQDVVLLAARLMGAGGPEYIDASQLAFTEHEQMIFTQAVAVAESFGRHISLLVVPAGDPFSALVQTANSLEAATAVAGLSSRMTAEEQAFYAGRAWEALPEPKRQFTFYVVMPDASAKSFHIGPHAPALQPQDVELVHQLWLRFRGDASMKELHHSDIVTYALGKLAVQYQSDRREVLEGLRRSVEDKGHSLGSQFAMESRIQKPMLPPAPADLDTLDAEEQPQSTGKKNE
jgi:hypothetical protein